MIPTPERLQQFWERMSEHECTFVEEQEPGGRLIVGPSLCCQYPAFSALSRLSLEALMLRQSTQREYQRANHAGEQIERKDAEIARLRAEVDDANANLNHSHFGCGELNKENRHLRAEVEELKMLLAARNQDIERWANTADVENKEAVRARAEVERLTYERNLWKTTSDAHATVLEQDIPLLEAVARAAAEEGARHALIRPSCRCSLCDALAAFRGRA